MYDINYFITKFSSIPGENWCTLQLDNGNGAHCAMGHTGCENMYVEGRFQLEMTEETFALVKIFGSIENVVNVNDTPITYPGVTPKDRILNHLYKLKELENQRSLVKFAEKIINEVEIEELVNV